MRFPKIILASKSPRRKELLSLAGFDFEVKTKEVNEDFPPGMPSAEVAQYIARNKAIGCASFLEVNSVLLTADTIVCVEEEILGKPVDAADAFQMIRKLAGRLHEVITGVCLKSHAREMTFAVTTLVEFFPLSDAEIEYYIEQFQPYDKAGAYAIQEWIGLNGIKRIEGDYFNVVGLPVSAIYQRLKDFDV